MSIKRFSNERFLQTLNETSFDGVLYQDWILVDDYDQSRKFKNHQFTLYLTFYRNEFVEVTTFNDCFNEKILPDLQKVFQKMNCDCFLLLKERKLISTTKKTEKMLADIEYFFPYLKIYHGNVSPHLAIPSLRSEMDLYFDFEKESIFVQYNREVIGKIDSKEEAEHFLKTWLSRSNEIEKMVEEALLLAKKHDKAAFLQHYNLYFFSNEFHLGFSYYLEENEIYYFTTLYSEEMGRCKETSTDVAVIKETVLDYLEKLIKKRRLKAAVQGDLNNFLYQYLTRIMKYKIEKKEIEYVFYSTLTRDEANEYFRTNHDRFSLKRIPTAAVNKATEKWVFPNGKTLKEFKKDMDFVQTNYEFGDYIILYLHDQNEDEPYFLMIKRTD